MPTVPAKSNSPLSVASAWARQNPRFTGVVQIRHTVRRGKARLGLAERTTVCYASGGAVATRREVRAGAARYQRYLNGPCRACGQVYRTCALAAGWDQDGRWLWACPSCHARLGLVSRDEIPEAGRESPLAVHRPEHLPVVHLEMRHQPLDLGDAAELECSHA